MLVSETKIFTPSRIKIKVISLEGVDLTLEVRPEMTVGQLKTLACSHLENPAESVKSSLYRRLVHVSLQRELQDDATIEQTGIKENDEILLLKKKLAPAAESKACISLEQRDKRAFDLVFSKTTTQKSKSKDTITDDDIKEATKRVEPKNMNRPVPESITSNDFKSDLRKILITLIEAAERILCLNPEAARVFKEAEEILDEQSVGEEPVDQKALQNLKDMGFTELRATKALLLNRMNTMSAMEWLLEHESDPDVDELVPGMPGYKAPDDPDEEKGAAAVVPTKKPKEVESPEDDKVSSPRRIKRILESFRILKQKEFKPNPLALKNLIEMGFEEELAISALRVSRNKQQDACELLLSGQKIPSQEEAETGLDPDSPVCRAILANPVVQLGLSNSRSLLAFLHILQNPNSTQQWLNDPDTGPMLLQISRIYQSEKHAASQGPVNGLS